MIKNSASPFVLTLTASAVFVVLVGGVMHWQVQRNSAQLGSLPVNSPVGSSVPNLGVSQEESPIKPDESGEPIVLSTALPGILPTISPKSSPLVQAEKSTEPAIPSVVPSPTVSLPEATATPDPTPTPSPTPLPTPYPFQPVVYTSSQNIGINFFYPADLGAANARDNGVSLGAQVLFGQLLASCGCRVYDMSVDLRSVNPDQPWASGGVMGFYDAPKHSVMVDGEEALVTDVMGTNTHVKQWMASIQRGNGYYFFYAELPDFVYVNSEVYNYSQNYPDPASIERVGSIFEYFVSHTTFL